MILLAACVQLPAAGDEQDANVKPLPPEHGCFYARQANGFDVIDDSNFIVYAPSKSNAFQVRIVPPSNDLEFADRIAFDGRSGRICGYAGETVSFGGRPAGRRYTVADVWFLNEDQLEYLKSRNKASGDGRQLEPQPTEGAEVERDLSGAEKSN